MAKNTKDKLEQYSKDNSKQAKKLSQAVNRFHPYTYYAPKACAFCGLHTDSQLQYAGKDCCRNCFHDILHGNPPWED